MASVPERARRGRAGATPTPPPKREATLTLLYGAVALVVAALGVAWLLEDTPPDTSTDTTIVAPATPAARPALPPDELANLERTRRAEAMALASLQAIEREATEAAARPGTSYDPEWWREQVEERRRAARETWQQRANLEASLRARFGDLPD